MSIASEGPPKFEEHEWDSYLIETNSEAAPASNFKQSLIPPTNEFNVGEKLESTDPRHQDSWCIGTVIDKAGPRIRIRLDGTDDRNDFWRLVDAADIRVYGKTAKLGGHIVPPLGFRQTSTRWAKYFEKNLKNGPFADELSFKPQPVKPEKNLFKKGQKLEAVDPKHSQLICPATVNNLIPGDHRIILSLDGWSSSNNFKIDYSSRDIFPVGWCKSAGIRMAKIGGHPTSRTSNKTSSIKKERREVDDIPTNNVKKEPLTVYWNYDGDNGGMLLNPQRFASSMPSIFGPSECNSVLKTIFDCCIKCSFQPTSLINRIRNLFPLSNANKQIELENGTLVNIPSIETEEDFWDAIRVFQNGILAGVDLFISTAPSLHSTTNKNKTEQSAALHHPIKRKSVEYNSVIENKTFLTNGKASKLTSDEKSAYDTKSSLNSSNSENDFVDISSNGIIRRPERFTPSDVARFVQNIDPSFENVACRFLQEEIDGKALLLLTTDTLMRHLGLKLGPSLKIIHHIEKLKRTE